MPGLSGSQKAYKQARSGIERCDTTRSNYYTPCNTIITIAGVNVSQYIQQEAAISWDKSSNNTPGTAQFTLKPGAPLVVAGQLVTISLGSVSNVEFAGQVQQPKFRLVGSTFSGGFQIYQEISCTDTRPLLDRRVINKEYVGMSASAIVIDIIDNWTSGFTRSGLDPNLPTIDDFIVSDQVASDALTSLANLIDCGWFLNAYDLNFFKHTSGAYGPNAGTNPVTLTPGLWSLKQDVEPAIMVDLSQQRTRTIVNGRSTTCPVAIPGNTTIVTVGSTAPVDALLVGGGGGGGSDLGGGGGGGQVIAVTDALGVTSYSIVIGTGGVAGVSSQTGGDGASTTFNGHTAIGGGAGLGTAGGGPGTGQGANSGGGAWGAGASAALSPIVAGGFKGGDGDNVADAAGGGGAGGPGQPGGTTGVISGGVGASSSISGTLMPYAGGGGGGSFGGRTGGGDGNGVTGGNGGADHSASDPGPGIANTGGGGGGGRTGGAGAAGGSGIVILSYLTGSLTATGGTITTVAGRTIHTFTSNGTFTISAITVVTPAQSITDIPIEDATQIDVHPGTVKIGNQITSYLSTGGPVLVAGANPPGTTVNGAVSAGATSVPVVDSTFGGLTVTSPGWAKIGDQYVRFTSTVGNTLTIPSTGFGSLTTAVSSGTQVSWWGQLNIASVGIFFTPNLPAGASVTQRVIVDDTVSQAAQAALEGGDGVHEHVVPITYQTIAGANLRGSAELQDYSYAIDSAEWDTEDLNAAPGRLQVINLGSGLPTTTLTVLKVTSKIIAPNTFPRRSVEAGTVVTASLLDAAVEPSINQ